MGFPLSFNRVEAIPISKDPGKVLVTWELNPTTLVLSDFEFYIDRGDSPDQIPAFQHVTIDGKPWTPLPITTDSVNIAQVSSAISALDFYEFVDITPLLRNLHKQYFYRVRVRRISTQEEIGSNPVTWKGDLDLEGIYVVDEHNFMLEDTTGVPCLIYNRRRSGVLCTNCFDPIQKKRTQSRCLRCFGTNWEGGFYKPIDSFVDLNPSPDETVIREWGETQPTETDTLFTNYPTLFNGDVVRELVGNRMWRVVRVRRTEKRRASMLQFVRLIEVNPGDIEYKLPVDEEFVKAKIRQLEDIKRLRSF